METEEEILAKFLKNTENHTLKIEMDSGVHRSLLFSKLGSSVYHYRITTWPGHLCISGDMGTFVFCRLHDMFDFFEQGTPLKINPSYWGGKLVAGTHEEYCGWEECVHSLRESEIITEGEFKTLSENYAETQFDACRVLSENIKDGWELGGYAVQYQHRYIWCLWAIVHAIQTYGGSHEV